MSDARELQPRVTPWTERFIDAIPLSPVWLAIATSGVLLAIYLVIEIGAGRHSEFLAGDLGEHFPREVRFGVVTSLALGYLVGANRALRNATRRNIGALRPLLRPPREGKALIEDELSPDPHGARVGGLMGIAVALAVPFAVDWGELPFFARGYWMPETTWTWAVLVPLGWMCGRLVQASLHGASLFSRLARSRLSVDLFDTRSLAPFVRQGMQTVLAWLGFIAVIALSLLNQRMGIVIAFNVLGALVVCVATLVLPLRGIHEQLVDAKAHELDWVRETIREERQRLREGGEVGSAAAARIPGILAYEARVEGISEWPFDVPTLLRLTLYLALPIGSWIGGALVEQLLGAALD
jgi:hypothetical protein